MLTPWILPRRPRVFWNDGSGHSLFVTGGATLEDRDGGTMDGALAPDGTAYTEALTTERFDLGALGRFELGAGWLLTARLSGMTQQHDHTFGEDLEHDRHSTAFGEATASRSTARTVTVLGLAWQGDVYRNRDLPAFDYDYSVPGVFVHEEWMASERVTLAGSLRLDHHSAYGTFLSPLLSALVRLGGTWTIRGSAGTGFYGPTPFTEETEVTGLSRLLPLSGCEARRRGAVRWTSEDCWGRSK